MGTKDFNTNVQNFFDYCRKGNTEKAKNWIQNKNKKQKSPLNFLRATTSGLGWLATFRDPSTSYTVLHEAALNGHLEIVNLLVEQDDELVNSKDRKGCLPLHLAVWNGHCPIVEQLLNKDPATINAVNNAKESSLHMATSHANAELISILLKNHADARLRNARFETALDIAARTGKENVCKLLICYSPELILQSATECHNGGGNTNRGLSSRIVYPLHSAARYGHTNCLGVLCEAGFDVNYVTDEGTPLHVAAIFGQCEALKLLLKYNADIGIKDFDNKTVLDRLNEKYSENSNSANLGSATEKNILLSCINTIKDATTIENCVKNEEGKVIWRQIPENSLAPTQTRHIHESNNNNNNNDSGNRNSSINSSISSDPNVTPKNRSVTHLPVFPITSPFLQGRHIATKRFNSANSPINIATVLNRSKIITAGNNTCSYQTPPFNAPIYKNVQDYVSIQVPLAYDNLSPPNNLNYDNAPSNSHRVWEHECTQNSNTLNPINEIGTASCSATISIANGRNLWKKISPNNGTKTVPVKFNASKFKRPSILDVFPGEEHEKVYKLDESQKDLKQNEILQNTDSSNSANNSTSSSNEDNCTNTNSNTCSDINSDINSPFCSLERGAKSDIIPTTTKANKVTFNKLFMLNSTAPIALPEIGEIAGSNCTTLFSMSPERSIIRNNNESFPIENSTLLNLKNRNRRSQTQDSTTNTCSTLTLIKNPQGMDVNSNNSNEHNECLNKPPLNIVNSSSAEFSDTTLASSCSLPLISQISSTSSSLNPNLLLPIPNIISAINNNNTNQQTNELERESQKKTFLGDQKQQQNHENAKIVNNLMENYQKLAIPTTTNNNQGGFPSSSTTTTMDHSDEWKKIDELLNEIQKDAFFQEIPVKNNEPVFLNLKQLPVSIEKNQTDSKISTWLNQKIGLTFQTAKTIGKILETNGFDNIHLMKNTLNNLYLTELNIEKSIQRKIINYLNQEEMKNSIRNVDEFEYSSDWLDSLSLIDYLGCFAKANLTYTSDIIAARLTRSDLEKMGVQTLGHLARIIASLNSAYSSSSKAESRTSSNRLSSTSSTKAAHSESTRNKEDDAAIENLLASLTTTTNNNNNDNTSTNRKLKEINEVNDEEEYESSNQRKQLLMDSYISFSAHYLGSMEISNVEGAEDCRRAMLISKKRIKQVTKVPQVILEISIGGVNVLDGTTNQLTVQHEIHRIQVVCQDELDLNCFSYIFQDGEKNFCHVYCVLTAGVAKEIIMTLGEAFNLAYSLLTKQNNVNENSLKNGSN